MKEINFHKLAEKWDLKPVELNGVADFGALYYETANCASTNDIVQAMALTGFPHGTVVRALTQSAGRGSRGAAWFSSPNALQCSFLIRPDAAIYRDEKLADLPFVNVLVSYAILKTIYSETRLPAMLKWPNDILVSGRKICGVMSEMRKVADTPYIVVGCGLNINVEKEEFPAELRSMATSVKIETGDYREIKLWMELFLQQFSVIYASYVRSTLSN